MYKVININIGGRIFQVEENAFETLKNYISSLKTYFTDKPEGNEIVSDIESRIAELLQNKLNMGHANITEEDVSEVIASMGSPKDIAGEDERETQSEPKPNANPNTERTHDFHSKARVYRDPDGKVISGVCSGLSYYFDIDPTIIRLIFIAFLFAGGSSVFIYIILLIVIPEARTTAEKLAMRKEKINIDTIQKSVEEELGKIKNTVTRNNYQGKVTGFFQKFFNVIGIVVTACFRFLIRLIGVLFVMVTIVLFMGMISVVTGHSFINGQQVGVFNTNFIHFFEDQGDCMLAQITVILGLFAAILIFFYLSRAFLLSKRQFANEKFFKRTIITVSILAFILFVISAFRTGTYFHSRASVENHTALDSTIKNYIIKTDYYRHRGYSFFVENDTLRIRDIELKIEETDGPAELVKIIQSYGQSMDKARENASNCSYNFFVKDSIITFPESFTLKKGQPYRKQKIIFILRLPAGTNFTVDRKANIRIRNRDYGHDDFNIGYTYGMNDDGYNCIDCNNDEVNGEDYKYSYKVLQIKKLEVSSALKIKIVKSAHIIVSARGIDAKDDLIVEDDNGSVKIHLKNNFFNTVSSDAEVIVYTPSVDDIEISGAVHAEITGFDMKEMRLSCTGASSCNAMLSLENLDVEVEGSSELHLSGGTQNLKASVSGVSKLRASEFMAQKVSVNASGASNAEVHAGKSIEAWAHGASNVFYSGDPESTNCVTLGVGKIEKR